jgi:hypothetical protein
MPDGEAYPLPQLGFYTSFIGQAIAHGESEKESEGSQHGAIT